MEASFIVNPEGGSSETLQSSFPILQDVSGLVFSSGQTSGVKLSPPPADISEHETRHRELYASLVLENSRLKHLNFLLSGELSKLTGIRMENMRLQNGLGHTLKDKNVLANVVGSCPRCTHIMGLVNNLELAVSSPPTAFTGIAGDPEVYKKQEGPSRGRGTRRSVRGRRAMGPRVPIQHPGASLGELPTETDASVFDQLHPLDKDFLMS